MAGSRASRRERESEWFQHSPPSSTPGVSFETIPDLLRSAGNHSVHHLQQSRVAKERSTREFSSEIFTEQREFEDMCESRMEEATAMMETLGKGVTFVPHRDENDRHSLKCHMTEIQATGRPKDTILSLKVY
jgi:hypothetical protein